MNESPSQLALRTCVREMIKERAITQRDLAARIGTSQKHLSQLLTGKCTLSLAWVDRIADACDYDLIIGTKRKRSRKGANL